MITKLTYRMSTKGNIIVSFTTSPTRIHIIQPMLQSIFNQTIKPDLFLINIPKVFHRTNQIYSIPEFIKNNQDITINVLENDYGPASKLVGTISYLKNQTTFKKTNTTIIYLDDDVCYPPKMIESYVKARINNNFIWTITGFNFVKLQIAFETRHNTKVQIAEGYGSVCVPYSCFHDDFEHYIDKYTSSEQLDCRLSDDMIFSNYFCKHNNIIKILNTTLHSKEYIWTNRCILDYGNGIDAIHNGANGTSVNNFKRYRDVISILNKNKERYFKLHFIQNGKLLIL